MSAAVQPMLSPNPKDMHAHLEHVFGGWLDGRHNGRVELCWSDAQAGPDGRYKLRHAETFDVEDVDALVERAVEVNSMPRTNVYIGAALRHPNTAPFGRCQDEDFYSLTAPYADLDDKDANDAARKRFADAAPTLVVETGRYPHWRHQLWWRLTDPIDDPERARALTAGIAHQLGGDTTITNPSRVMRLAGTIAWDQKPGRRPELTRIVTLKSPGQRVYVPEHLERVYTPLYQLRDVKTARHAPGPNVGIVREKNIFGLPGKVTDGRERHMTNVICARLIDYIGRWGSAPTPEELFEHAWDPYERSTDLSRAGRNKGEFLEKCRSTMRRFQQGKIRGARSLDEAVESFKSRREAEQENVRHEAKNAPDEEDEPSQKKAQQFVFETIADLRKLPPVQYLIKGWIPAGSSGLFYGKWAAGKSFIAFDASLHLAYGMPHWHGAELPAEPSDVLVIAREGHQGFVQRIDAFKHHHGIKEDTDRLHFMRGSVSFMRDSEFSALCMAVKAQNRPYRLILIDTVARVLPGVDMNEQQTVTLFTERCSILAEITGAAALGVHHQNKGGGMMGSTYFEANSDFVFEVTRLGDEDGPLATGEITCTKMKDGEDRWKRSVAYSKIALGPDSSSLVVGQIGDHAPPPKEGFKWPPRDVCEAVLEAMGQAWRDGQPWSPSPQTAYSGRFAQRLMTQWNIPRKLADHMLLEWAKNRVISEETRDKHTKMKGFNVIGSI